MKKILAIKTISDLEKEYGSEYEDQIITTMQDYARNLIELEYIIDQISFDFVTELSKSLGNGTKFALDKIDIDRIEKLELLTKLYFDQDKIASIIQEEFDMIVDLNTIETNKA